MPNGTSRGLPDLRELTKTADALLRMPLQTTVAVGEALIEGGDLLRAPLAGNPFERVAALVRKGFDPLSVLPKAAEIVGAGRRDPISGNTVKTTIF